jgi:hypothetical protein
MSADFTFHKLSGMIFSISSYCYEALVDFREGIEVDGSGNFNADYELFTRRMILVEIAFIPLIVLSSIETVVRGALYLIATPLFMGVGIYTREKNQSIGSGILEGVKIAFIHAMCEFSWRKTAHEYQ